MLENIFVFTTLTLNRLSWNMSKEIKPWQDSFNSQFFVTITYTYLLTYNLLQDFWLDSFIRHSVVHTFD
jgi:hypothetical protein